MVWRMDGNRANLPGHLKKDFTTERLLLVNASPEGASITQQATWLRLDGVKGCGGVDPDLHYAMDADLYVRYTYEYPKVRYVDVPLAVFRLQQQSKTSLAQRDFQQDFLGIAEKVLKTEKYSRVHDTAEFARKRLKWRERILRLREQDKEPRWKRAFLLAADMLREPAVRLDRHTLGALRGILLQR
jgi:hypothetical protein